MAPFSFAEIVFNWFLFFDFNIIYTVFFYLFCLEIMNTGVPIEQQVLHFKYI